VSRLFAAASIAALLTLSASTAEAQDDPWLSPDKALHFGVSAGLAGAGYGVGALIWDDYAPRILLGAGLSLSLGIAKELVDLAGTGDASWKDLTWDLIGTAFGLLVAILVDVSVRQEHRRRARAP
jgi:putative lipoprotein